MTEGRTLLGMLFPVSMRNLTGSAADENRYCAQRHDLSGLTAQ